MHIHREDVSAFAKALQAGGTKIVFTNGCFDILHIGHVRYLQAARALGDFLLVGLNTDASVRRLKGSSRPVNHAADRAEVLNALRCVDGVVFFDEDTAEALVREIRPAVYVKGGDYTLDTLPEAKIVQSYGGTVHLINLVPNHSTTNIIARMRQVELPCK